MPHYAELYHPDTHQAASPWSEEQTLHVTAAYSNPFRWRTRRELANDFRRQMAACPNVVLHMVELAYGDRPFEVTHPSNHLDIQLRTSHELWHKENLLNIGVRSFPKDWKYGAYWDADFTTTRHDWALESIHLLQHYDWIQLFAYYANLTGDTVPGEGHQITGTVNGFAYTFINNGHQMIQGAQQADYGAMMGQKRRRGAGNPGGAWAFRRSAFDTCGGFLDKCILGSGDGFMAFGLAGTYDEIRLKKTAETLRHWSEVRNIQKYSEGYRGAIRAWQERAARLTKNISYLDHFAVHHFHGPMDKRGYMVRDKILIEEEYDPNRDVFYDWQGVLQLNPAKPRLRDRIRTYFLSRCEDLSHRG